MFKEAKLHVSTYVIPLLMVLYIQCKDIRKLIIYHMLPISIIGIVDVLKKKRTIIEKISVIIGHLLFFIVVFFYKPTNYKLPKIIYPITLLIAISIIINMPTWKYLITKKHMIILYSVIYSYFIFHTENGALKFVS
tara:strand:- start:318 stop:725 length:408 start_codon:yes stop_codon:yes gene_type:complete